MSSSLTSPIIDPEVKAEIHRIFALQSQQQWEVARSTASQRITRLKLLHDTILRYRSEINEALWADLRKGPTEVILSELGVVLQEIRHTTHRLRSWMTPKKVGTSLTLFRSHSEILYEPKGVCLVISPWNFPLNLCLDPLISAVAAGNCVMLKPSEFSPNINAVIKKILSECFPPGEVSMIEGDAVVAQELLSLPFNHIFFTGSPQVGKIVMRAAAEYLASVTLELGGKSPVIVDRHADLDKAADKIVWLKGMNLGQICIAPDYVLVHESVHDALVEKMKQRIQRFYGNTYEEILQCPDLARLITANHFKRVKTLLDDAVQRGAKVEFGGQSEESQRFICPTILTDVPEESKVWEEEIFGPILPVRKYQDEQHAVRYLNARPKPLAMYLYSQDNRWVNRMLSETRCGGVTVNDSGPHFYNSELPFGGSNYSGIGKCHGEAGFLEFTNQRGVLRQTRWFATSDWFLPPYGKSLWRKWILEGVVRWF